MSTESEENARSVNKDACNACKTALENFRTKLFSPLLLLLTLLRISQFWNVCHLIFLPTLKYTKYWLQSMPCRFSLTVWLSILERLSFSTLSIPHVWIFIINVNGICWGNIQWIFIPRIYDIDSTMRPCCEFIFTNGKIILWTWINYMHSLGVSGQNCLGMSFGIMSPVVMCLNLHAKQMWDWITKSETVSTRSCEPVILMGYTKYSKHTRIKILLQAFCL